MACGGRKEPCGGEVKVGNKKWPGLKGMEKVDKWTGPCG